MPPKASDIKTKTKTKIKKMEELVPIYILENIVKYLNNHKNGKGMWYSSDYYTYLKKRKIELSHETAAKMYDGYANPNFFNKTGPFTFVIKKGKKPSDALMAFLEGPTLADCNNVTMAIYYKVILDIIGHDKFNEIFKTDLKIQPDIPSPLDQFLIAPINPKTIKIGEHLHIGGIRWYANKHPAGFDGGWNVIHVGHTADGNALYAGHGLRNPVTYQELCELFLKYYNLNRSPKDYEYIEKANNTELYDREANQLLKDYYVIGRGEMTQNPTKFLEGFLPFTQVGLRYDILAQFHNTSTK